MLLLHPNSIPFIILCIIHRTMGVSITGGTPQMDGLQGKIPLKWMIQGYLHLRNPPVPTQHQRSMRSQAATFALRATSALDASIPVAQIPAAGAILERRDVPGGPDIVETGEASTAPANCQGKTMKKVVVINNHWVVTDIHRQEIT